jgi:hypothetical protein
MRCKTQNYGIKSLDCYFLSKKITDARPEHAARTKRKIINLRFVESNEHAITLTIV